MIEVFMFLRSLRTCSVDLVLLFITVVVLFPASVIAQDDNLLEPVSSTYAITHVNIIPAPGLKIEDGTVVIRRGIIEAVGKGVAVPPDAIVIRADSMFLYAGFIDCLSHIAVEKRNDDNNNNRLVDPGDPPCALAGITPEADVRDFLNCNDPAIQDYRSLGFTAAQVVPKGMFLPGNGAIILLGGKSADAMVLRPNSSLYSEFTWSMNLYPSTVMGFMAKWRELYRQSEQAQSYGLLYAKNNNGMPRPSRDRVLEAFYPVINKQAPVLFRADNVLDIQRALTLQTDLKIPALMLGDVKEGWYIINRMKTSGAKIFLSLDLPKEEKESTGDTTRYDPEKKALRVRQQEFAEKYMSQAAEFQKAGVKFGFSIWCTKSKYIRPNLLKMIQHGLSEDVALAALTVNPAEMLGVSHLLGTVEKGKIANLVITDKPYFNEKSRVNYVFVDGELYGCKKPGTKESAKGKTTSIEGAWSFTTDTPQGKVDLKVIFKKENNQYTGQISGGKLPDNTQLTSVSYTGSKLRFVYSVVIVDDKVEVTVDGTMDEKYSFKGDMIIGQYGSFPIAGTKDPE